MKLLWKKHYKTWEKRVWWLYMNWHVFITKNTNRSNYKHHSNHLFCQTITGVKGRCFIASQQHSSSICRNLQNCSNVWPSKSNYLNISANLKHKKKRSFWDWVWLIWLLINKYLAVINNMFECFIWLKKEPVSYDQTSNFMDGSSYKLIKYEKKNKTEPLSTQQLTPFLGY